MTQETNAPQMYRAWRFIGKQCLYVQTVAQHGAAGDRYSYTDDLTKAATLSEKQCKAFCTYLRDCATVGFWGMR